MRDSGGGGGRGVSWGGRGAKGGGQGGGQAGQLTQRVAQAAEEVQTFAAQRALELALEANGLTQAPAMQGFTDELERAALGAAGMGNPITEGPASRILTAPRRMAVPNQDPAGAMRGAAQGWQQGLAEGGRAGGVRPRPMPAPRPGPVGSTFHQVPTAPLGGPSAISRVGRPRRPSMADKGF
jgi:hypothetical protein